jgi:hypothetical protein
MMIARLLFAAVLFIATQTLTDVSLNRSNEPIITHAATVASTIIFSFGKTTEDGTLQTTERRNSLAFRRRKN